MLRAFVIFVATLLSVLSFAQEPGGGGGGTSSGFSHQGFSGWQVTVRRCITDTIHQKSVYGSTTYDYTYTRDTSNGNFSWYLNGSAIGYQPSDIITANIECSWDISGYYEIQFNWIGQGAAPATLPIEIDASILMGHNYTGSGTCSNGYGDTYVTLTGPDKPSMADVEIQSRGKHLRNIDIVDGQGTLITEQMTGHVQDSWFTCRVYGMEGTSIKLSNKSVSISSSPSSYDKGGMIGVTNFEIPFRHKSGTFFVPVYEYDIIPIQANSYGTGTSFSIQLKRGVPTLLQSQLFPTSLQGHATILGQVGNVDHFSWTGPGDISFPSTPWTIPPHSDPGSVSKMNACDLLLFSSPDYGMINDINWYRYVSDTSETYDLSYFWNDGVNGNAKGIVNYKPIVTDFTHVHYQEEAHDKWISATGWNPGTISSVQVPPTDIAKYFKWVNVAATSVNTIAVATGGQAIPLLTGVALVANVTGTIIGSPQENIPVDRVTPYKIWPDPAITGYPWWHNLSGGEPAELPIGSFQWKTQYKPIDFINYYSASRWGATGYQGENILEEVVE
ncbi:MAG: hypothetical protein KDC26_11145, partial [Armatimonadetes bacterium]|nr:hypothetical protein [Armatimonadota bacterium]